MESLFSVGL